MRENLLRKKWASGQPTLGGWLMLPSSISAEIMAHAGFDWLCVDMQHGLIDYPQMLAMLQGISATEVTPLVRVPWNETGIIGKTLDAGARGIIIPMVNSPEDAQIAVAACRYAPVGRRSFGPVRASTHYGSDYYSRANDDVLCIVMIETRQAVENVDKILSVTGVDAVYVGPADLSVTLGLQPALDQTDTAFNDALKRICDSCKRNKVVPGIAGGISAIASKRIEQGFLLVDVASDVGLLSRGAAQALQQVRPAGQGAKS